MRRADVMSRFHLGMGFSPHSAVQLCPFSRPMRTDFQTTGLYGTGYVFSRPPMPTREKNAFRANGTGLVLYIQSYCIGRRDRLVERLEAAGVSVDALGKCRNNKPNPFPWKDFEFLSTLSQLRLVYMGSLKGDFSPAFSRWTNLVEFYVGACKSYTSFVLPAPIGH